LLWKTSLPRGQNATKPSVAYAQLLKTPCLTSFRIKDQTHIKDLDDAGLIGPEIEATLSAALRERLVYVREHD
jgi:hypothetical protein